jgi:hypothetical protein
VHAFTHADKSIFSLVRDLAIRPGVVASEYIAGKRKKYFNPFSFFLILMGLFVLSNLYFNPKSKVWTPDSAVLSSIPTETGKKQYMLMSSRAYNMSVFLNKNGNILAMIAVPFIALIGWLCYRRSSDYNYAEFFTAVLLFVTFSNLFFTVFIYPLQGAYRGTSFSRWLPLAGLLLQVIYYSWCYCQFIQADSSRVKAFGVSLLSVVLWVMVTTLAMSLYMYRGWDFYKFFTQR